MSKKRQQYSSEFKAKVALAVVRGDETVPQLATRCLTSITLSARVASTENVTTNVNAINPVSRWFFCQSTLLAFWPAPGSAYT